MEAVRRTVELGRAARAQAAVKVRQPLRRAVVVANDAEREAIVGPGRPRHRRSSTSRSSSSSPRSPSWSSYEVKPNYRALGPRFGKQMPQVAAAVEALDADERRRGDRRRAARSGSTSTAASTRSAPTT